MSMSINGDEDCGCSVEREYCAYIARNVYTSMILPHAVKRVVVEYGVERIH